MSQKGEQIVSSTVELMEHWLGNLFQSPLQKLGSERLARRQCVSFQNASLSPLSPPIRAGYPTFKRRRALSCSISHSSTRAASPRGLFNSGSVSSNKRASCCAVFIKPACRSRSAIRNRGNPDCAVPNRSPAPRRARSASAIRKPSSLSRSVSIRRLRIPFGHMYL